MRGGTATAPIAVPVGGAGVEDECAALAAAMVPDGAAVALERGGGVRAAAEAVTVSPAGAGDFIWLARWRKIAP